MKTIISLHGSYFGNNYGDILLVSMFAKWIKETEPDCIVNLPLANKSNTKNLPKGTTGIINLLKSKALVFCGGGYFGEQPHNKGRWAVRNFFRHAIVGLLAIIFHIPYAIIGVEFGPLSKKWFRMICIVIAKHATVVVVRNVESQSFLHGLGVKNVLLAADAVLSLSDIVPIQSNRNSKKILLHLAGINHYKNQVLELCKQIVKVLSEINAEYTIVLINDTYTDIYHSKSYKDVISILDKSEIPYTIYDYRGPNDLIGLINSVSFVATTKLHVGITAAALNIRPLSFWLHPKTKRLHAQIGNAQFCYPINNPTYFHSSIHKYFTTPIEYILPSEVKEAALFNKTILTDFIRTVKHHC